jgi:hypothetical protein
MVWRRVRGVELLIAGIAAYSSVWRWLKLDVPFMQARAVHAQR